MVVALLSPGSEILPKRIKQKKVRQQQNRARKNKEDNEIREMMRKLETKKQNELRLQLERERVRRELQSVDQTQLGTIEVYSFLYFTAWLCMARFTFCVASSINHIGRPQT